MRLRIVLAFAMLLAFALAPVAVRGDPLVPPYVVKWSQMPDMDQGTDWLSIHQTDGPVVVDDFMSNGMPIVGFHWWGSYLDGLDPDPGMWKSFEISFHTDVPAGQQEPFSVPSQTYQFQIVLAQETFYGQTVGGENVYEYWAKIDPWWSEEAGEIYWVDFALDQALHDRDWGWHESCTQWNDFAVQTQPPSPGGNPHLGPWAPLDRDMAFEVLTIPEPATMLLLAGGFGVLAFRRKKKS
jgi:hypothetical protein